jgi:hypothetical protein
MQTETEDDWTIRTCYRSSSLYETSRRDDSEQNSGVHNTLQFPTERKCINRASHFPQG